MNILNILDNQLNGFYQKNNKYPKTILMGKDTKDKVFKELDLESALEGGWKDKKDNYKGIKIEIKEDIFIELE